MTKDTCDRRAGAAKGRTRTGRRAVLKGAVAGGLAFPAIVRDAFSSSGEVSWFTWEDYAPKPLIERFEKDTGIKLKVTTFSSNEDCLNKLKAAGGSGWDLTSPSIAWVSAHTDNGSLGVIEEGKLPNLSKIIPSFMDQSARLGARKDGKWYALPYDWGTEALAWNTTKTKLEYGKASFSDLWKPEYANKMLCRQRSIMLATGLAWEREGKLPPGTMMKAYDDEAAFDLGYTKTAEFVVANKKQIVNWWKGAADTQSGFEQDGAVIAECWDGPIFTLKNSGKPYAYLAPVEGALTWIDSIALTAKPANVAQAYEFINWTLQPQIGGIVSDNTGYNSVVQGFDNHVEPSYKKNFAEAYPEDAIPKLWVQGTERPWFLAKRQALVDKISAAR